jgi:alpha-mannosidase
VVGNESSIDSVAAPALPVRISSSAHSLEIDNGILRVQVTNEGVSFVKGDRILRHAVTLETTRDEGDSYTPAIRGNPEQLRLVKFRVGATGPLRAGAVIEWATLGRRTAVRVSVRLSLDAESEVLRVDIRGNNQRKDHRLRLHFHTGIQQETAPAAVWADAAFGAVQRAPLAVPLANQQAERVVPTMPMHRWVSLTNANGGATLHSDGLAEVETLADGTVALTLLRCIGELSRNNLVERPGHAGWPSAIPLAQSAGPFRARLGLQLHGAWSSAVQEEIEVASDALLLPLTGETWRDLSQQIVTDIAGPLLTGAGLRMSAVSLADDGDGIVLRCINDADDVRTGAWVLPFDAPWEVARARLDETLLEPWRASSAQIPVRVTARGGETFRVRRRER